MRENSCDKINDRNWLLKRKRKRFPCNSEVSTGKKIISPESSKSNSSTKQRIKEEAHISQSERKLRGHDGHYFECVKCDLGGNLLCCDNCPQTYHLECLTPPLKRAPPGKWKCPNCFKEKDSMDPLRHPEVISKRARTKSASAKARADLKLSCFGKVLQTDSCIDPENNRSLKKGKSTGTTSGKKEGSLQANVLCSSNSGHSSDSGLKDNISLEKHGPSYTPDSSSGKKIQSSIKVCNKKSSTKASKLKSNFFDGIHSVHKSSKKTKKKNKVVKEDKKMGNSATIIIKKPSKKKTSSSSVSGSHKKCSSRRRQVPSLEDQEISDSPKQNNPEGTLGDSVQFRDDVVLQVHRILGCRMQDSELRSASASGVPITGQTNIDRDENHLHDLQTDNNMTKTMDTPVALDEEGIDANNQSAVKSISASSIIIDDGQSDRKSQNADDVKEVKVPREQDTIQEKEDSENVKMPSKNIDTQLDEITLGDFSANAILPRVSVETSDQKATGISGLNVSYEFLVKWVGKSVIHNSWLPESQVKHLAKRKLENYKTKYGTSVINICQEQWGRPQRVIALRSSKYCNKEALVKWHGLPYDECTWERLDEPIIQSSSHLISQFNEFQSQTLKKDNEGNSQRIKSDLLDVIPLAEQPQELKGGSLFPHQLEALNWLRKCWHKSKNVILADEMGLGKTISASAFISSLYLEFKVKFPCIVLVPLSTMPNWFAEFSLWAPHLNVVEYHGSAKARSVIRQYEWHASDPDGTRKVTMSYKFNVLLTTYEMILTDYTHLRAVPWEVLVVDEGHRLKNSESKLFNMLNTFSFQHRILLTGTPLQNNIGEMYNLLNFLQPVSFPSLSAFEENFNDLTTTEKVEELKKLVAPHMLRRLKKDAMQNIPPKTERMIPVELSSIQAEYYRAMLTKNYQVLRNLGRGGVHSMLNIVMQLRKVCNHPYLIPGTEPESGSLEFLHEMRIKASAKLTLLHSMLKILRKEGHRVLIFSQMTKLLDILEDYVTIEFGPKTFERVDGSVSVSDRQIAIARFNQDKSRFIFLLSTRSCGLGINLASADTVIIYDSDFNPHADIQAMNRAHRIGQSNRLLVYRFVVRASVEERILQLARKKLMLDQLFVNKSESQKEVEDILRWGTEELFGDCAGTVLKDNNGLCSNKSEGVADGEQRHRKRVGGLGDVYQDRCTDGSTNVLWDETAILKLLDRSILQDGPSDSVDVDLENDMLGSVKEWNDDSIDEVVTELPPDVTFVGDAHASEGKDDNVVNDMEKNEWDRLLRSRWEKYQNEKEASLGRGKRLRKAVSYRENFATLQNETLSESGNDEEPEPEPEYTADGKAFKEKYAKLRARQKERLSRMHAMGENFHVGALHLPESTLHILRTLPREEGVFISDPVEANKDLTTSHCDEDINSIQASLYNSRLGKFTKHNHKRHKSSPLDLSGTPSESLSSDIFLPNQQVPGTSFSTSLAISNHLPVLGLCAPNASQLDAAKRNLNTSLSSMPISDQKAASFGIPEFPFLTGPGSSSDVNSKSRKTANTESPLPEVFKDTFHDHLKNIISNSYFPFNPHLPTHSGSGLHTSKEKMGFADFSLDENKHPKFPLASMHEPTSFSDFPSLTMDLKNENKNEISSDFPNIPLVPNFRHLNESLKQKQKLNDSPTLLGHGQMHAPNFLPDNHKKVLENIMMRTGSGTHRSAKKKQKANAWSDDELDALWIGVRRHGRGNWDAMLRDSKLKFSRYKTPEDLFTRWSDEQQKLMDGPALLVQNSSRSTTFPGVSDEMMSRALFGNKFIGHGTLAPKFQSHLTDIKLGCGDLLLGGSSNEINENFGAMVRNSSLFPHWQPGRVSSNAPGDFLTGTSDVTEKINLPFDLPFQKNALHGIIGGSLGMYCLNSSGLVQNQDKKSATRITSHGHDLQKNPGSSEFDAGFPDQNKMFASSQHLGNNNTDSDCSKIKNLPHWLRDAVSVSAARPPEPCLPPFISAIAHSVRLIYGEETSLTIPPFTMHEPLLSEPKDPRENLKKKQKMHGFNRLNTDIASSSKKSESLVPLSSSSIHVPPTCTDTNVSLQSLNLNLNCSTSPFLNNKEKIDPSVELHHSVAQDLLMFPTSEMPDTVKIVPPVSDVLEAVEDNRDGMVSVTQDLLMLPTSEMSDTGKIVSPVSDVLKAVEDNRDGMVRDFKAIDKKMNDSKDSLLGDCGKLAKKNNDKRLQSGNSSETGSYHGRTIGNVEILSEEALSDGHQSEYKS